MFQGVLDHEMYILNLTDVNEKNISHPVWQKEYAAKVNSHYGSGFNVIECMSSNNFMLYCLVKKTI